MGPLATNIFYKEIIDHTQASKDQDHIWTVISSHSTMPDRTKVILENLDKEIILKDVRKDLEIMEAAKVDLISIPCNTFHYFYDEVAKETKIEILNMIDLAVKEFKNLYGNKALILSTVGTRQAKVYEKYGKLYGLETIKIDDKFSKAINDLIYRIKSTGETYEEDFKKLVGDLQAAYKPDGFMVACTELSVIDRKGLEFNIIDSMDILVRESIKNLGYTYKEG